MVSEVFLLMPSGKIKKEPALNLVEWDHWCILEKLKGCCV